MRINIGQPLGFSDIGHRDIQQDAIYPNVIELNTSNELFVICDGMGGHTHGEIASATITNSLAQNINIYKKEPSTETFKLLLETAWNELDTYYDIKLGEQQMGTTLSFLAFTENGYCAAHIGDSRIYHIRPANITQFIYKSTDHSHVADMIDEGEISQLEALKYRGRNVLNKAMIPLSRFEAEIYESKHIKAGDYFMLCSDGVTEYLTDEMIKFIFLPYRTPDEILELIHQHCQHLSDDNNSCIIIPVNSVEEKTMHTIWPLNPSVSSRKWVNDDLLKETIKSLNNIKLY